MKKIISVVFTWSMFMMVLFYFVQLAITGLHLEPVMSFFGLSLLISSLWLFGLLRAKFQIILISMSVLVSYFAGDDVMSSLWNGLREMQNLFPLTMLISMIGWILHQEPYVESLYYYNRQILKSSTSYYGSFLFLVQIVAYFMIAGAIILVYQFMETLFKNKKGEAWDFFRNSSLMRGYALTGMWSISLPSFAYAITAVGAPLLRTELQGLLLSLFGTALALFLYWRYEKKQGTSLTKEIHKQMMQFNRQEPPFRLVIEFGLIFAVLFISVFLLHEWFDITILTLIPIVVFIITFLYFGYKRKMGEFGRGFVRLVTTEIPRKYGEVSFVICAGLLIYAMRTSTVGDFLFQVFYQGTQGVVWLNFLLVLPLFILALGLIGISPMTIMVLMGGVIQNAHLPYPPDLIVLSLTIGTVLCFLLSPVTITVIIMSGVNGKTPMENSFKSHWRFAIMFFILAEIYLELMILFRQV